ncbi:MAG: benzaldehyde lyase [SAR116 cluster bacterium MED-G04]|jgi:acetolactate synthase-1/2/3 large subunit|nr:benzaldehyde lyase [SAR116 cluster bacterium]OUW37023.1 MAG: benzaldehyde lyase [Gammaproteobacteria bacterium TMED183]PDH66717.1 MAG: benzaldehyde lyase [SAR116 cluster bacterium MED-G04]HCD49437.1 benzaldehyde lyase [Alphaproteobacteria bacterium]HCV63577.1 benzaldehyde lyase [Alphaproteobacteria bacterium]|tara:strand:- start:246 stop:1988 length:1743 start_codon:yes stop_codon:yes gene_type:complete
MNSPRKIRGGALLARALQEKGIEHVFTLSGGFCNPALEGFMECQMKVINCPHEQIAGHFADGHTRITRKPSVCLVGPEGFANAVPAMMEAWGERSPVIFVTGSSTLKRQGAGGFKEIDDVAIAEPLTKYSATITDGERINEFVDRAYKMATNGYPGAVHLSLPVDIMFSSFAEDAGRQERPFDLAPQKAARAWPEPARLQQVLDKVSAARRPVLIGGHGVWWSGAEAMLEEAGRKLAIPIFNIPYHQKLLGEECEAYMGLADVHQYHPSADAFHEADLVLMLGARLDNQMNFGNPPLFPETAELVCINGSHEEIDFNRAADFTLLSDPGAFLEALIAHQHSPDFTLGRDWYDLNRQRRAEWVEKMLKDLDQEASDPAFGGRIHPLQLALDVQEAMSDDDWLVIDGGNTHFWSEIAVNIAGHKGRKLGGILHPGTFSMLGVGVSFAISAKNVHPDRNIVLISGDGAFLSGGLSIEAAFQENRPVTVIIDNNGGLDCISQQQERLFESGKHYATDFRDIPFHSMFEGLGGYGEVVTRREDIIPAVKRAMASGKTACVNVKVKGVISPIVLATTSKRDKASIE